MDTGRDGEERDSKVQIQVENGKKLTIIGWGPWDSKEDRTRKGQDTYTYLCLIICSLIVAATSQYHPPARSSYIPQLSTIFLSRAAQQALSPRFYAHRSRVSNLEDRTIFQGRAHDGRVEVEWKLRQRHRNGDYGWFVGRVLYVTQT